MTPLLLNANIHEMYCDCFYLNTFSSSYTFIVCNIEGGIIKTNKCTDYVVLLTVEDETSSICLTGQWKQEEIVDGNQCIHVRSNEYTKKRNPCGLSCETKDWKMLTNSGT